MIEQQEIGHTRESEWRVVTDADLAEFLGVTLSELVLNVDYSDVAVSTVETDTQSMTIIGAMNAILAPAGLQARQVARGEGGFRAECVAITASVNDEEKLEDEERGEDAERSQTQANRLAP